MIVNIDNTTTHKYIVQSLRVYEWLDPTWLSIHFLFLSKNDIS